MLPTPGVELVAVGETMALVAVDGYGRVEVGSAARIGYGGAETNVLVGAARLGVAGAWVGAVGADAFGEMLLRTVAAEGIDVTAVARRSDLFTAAMVKWRRNTLQTGVDYLRRGSAGASLGPGDVPEALPDSVRVVHTTGITAGLSTSALHAVRRAVAVARAGGAWVSFDVNHRTKVWGEMDPRVVYAELAAQADVVLCSEDEAAHLLDDPPGDPADLARAIAATGPRWVVVKRGAAGATMLADGEVAHAPAREVTVHDPVGAGDALAAGVLVGLIRELPLPDALQLGVDLGTYACTVEGDCANAPDPAELAAFRQATGEVTR
jgi:2-dehydro-3-deoxygluconokinase